MCSQTAPVPPSEGSEGGVRAEPSAFRLPEQGQARRRALARYFPFITPMKGRFRYTSP